MSRPGSRINSETYRWWRGWLVSTKRVGSMSDALHRAVRVPPPLAGEPPAVASAWSPLRQPLFRALWIATVVSNLGTWMHNVGAAWLMTSLTLSPTLVALVQAATSLPVFLVALPAGGLADAADRP